ncbi:SYP61 [Symbiodinium sp. KB8]|nr:SYP61 [Symbiodinium sp. KB8]
MLQGMKWKQQSARCGVCTKSGSDCCRMRTPRKVAASRNATKTSWPSWHSSAAILPRYNRASRLWRTTEIGSTSVMPSSRPERTIVGTSQMAHQEINSSLSSAAVQNKFDEDRRQALLRNQRQAKETAERNLAQESKAFLEEQRLLQKQLLAQQEDELQALEKGAQRLGQVAYTINGEIESQQKLLDELNQDIEKEMERMDVVTKGMGALLKTSNKAQIYAVGGAIVLFVILVFLILNT